MRLKHLARYLFCVVCYHTGVVELSRSWRAKARQPRVLILAYHSFSEQYDYLSMATPPSLFVQQVAYLRQHFEVRTLGELVSSASSRRTSGRFVDTVVLTVDDGYADNYEPLMYAARELQAPASLYVATNFIDQQRPTTVMALMMAIHGADVQQLDMTELGLGVLPLRSHAERNAAIQQIDAMLKFLAPDRQRYFVDHVAAQCGADLAASAKKAMLTWDQLRAMSAAGIEIGAHTRSHPVLSRLHPDAVRAEIQGSMRRIREQTGRSDVTFAYPYGGVEDVSPEVIEVCRHSGVAAAALLQTGRFDITQRFALSRTMVDNDLCTSPWGEFSVSMWACELEGVVDSLRRCLVPPKRMVSVLETSLSILWRLALVSVLDADWLIALLRGFVVAG